MSFKKCFCKLSNMPFSSQKYIFKIFKKTKTKTKSKSQSSLKRSSQLDDKNLYMSLGICNIKINCVPILRSVGIQVQNTIVVNNSNDINKTYGFRICEVC